MRKGGPQQSLSDRGAYFSLALPAHSSSVGGRVEEIMLPLSVLNTTQGSSCHSDQLEDGALALSGRGH